MPDLTIIIVNWNTRKLLADCLSSLFAHTTTRNFDVIVVDNASIDGSANMCALSFPQVRVLQNSRNVGFGRANNLGVSASSAPLCWLLNSDTVVRPGCIDAICDAIAADESVAIVGCRLLNRDGTIQFSCMRFPSLALLALQESMLYRLLPSRYRLFIEPPLLHARTSCDWVYGAAMLVRKEAFERVGGFDPRIWMYGEEMDLCSRLRQAGWGIMFEPAAAVVHYGEGSWRGDAARPILLRQRGLLHFYRQHYSTLTVALAWMIVVFGNVLRSAGWIMWTMLHLFHRQGRSAGWRRASIHLSVLASLLIPLAGATSKWRAP